MKLLDNPIATPEQLQVESDAIRIFGMPQVRAAVDKMAAFYATQANAQHPEQAARIRAAAESGVFHVTVIAVNEDPANPKILATELPAHRWMGIDVPDARHAIDNPDNIYRIMPVDARSSYRLEGRFPPRHAADFNLTVLTEYFGEKGANATVGYLDENTLEISEEGRFEITFDNSPAEGRVNHVTLAPDARFVFFRESLKDWVSQSAATMQVARLTGPLCGNPKSDDELAGRAAELALAANKYFFERIMVGQCQRSAPNEVPPPFASGQFGGLVTQVGRLMQYALEDDEALILSADKMGAGYFAAQLTDLWTVSYDYGAHLSCLNDFEIAPDEDGRLTLVISPRDPGVHNWLDGGGQHSGAISLRWQRLPLGNQPESESVRGQVVKLADLRDTLPRGTRFIEPHEREKQRKLRAAGFARRFAG